MSYALRCSPCGVHGVNSADSCSDDFFGIHRMADCYKLIRIYFKAVPSFCRREEIQITVVEGTKFHGALNSTIRIPEQDRITAEHTRCVSVRSVLECKIFTVVSKVVHYALPRYSQVFPAFRPDPCEF